MSRGFTLVELVFALSLSSLVLLAAVSLFGPMASTQKTLVQRSDSEGEALLVLKAVRREVAQASFIATPGPNGAADELSGCANYDPRRGSGAAARIDPSRPASAFHFCVAGDALYLHSTRNPSECPVEASCGEEGGVLLARGVSPQSGSRYFTRRLDLPNLVEARVEVARQSLKVPLSLSVSFQGPLP